MKVPTMDGREATLVDDRCPTTFETHVDRAAPLGLDELCELGRTSPRDVPGRLSAGEAGARSFVLQGDLDEGVEGQVPGGGRPVGDGFQPGVQAKGDRDDGFHAPLHNLDGYEVQPLGNYR